jgi:HEAT repeat protein
MGDFVMIAIALWQRRIRGWSPSVVLLLVFIVGWCGDATAIAPPHVSDVELAKYPIIVVAQWEKAPFVENNRHVSENAIDRIESYTRLKVLSVVKGKVEAGDHELLVGPWISWKDDGTFLNSASSTLLLGDVPDVTKPSLWFIERTRSWDEKRKDEYLTASNYREVQPIELKAYFEALGGRDAEKDVPKLLASKEPAVTFRVLNYISGEHWPWPFVSNIEDGFDFGQPDERGKVLSGEADRVWALMQSGNEDIRPLAAAIYADLRGKESVAKLRTLLDDKDPEARGVGAAVLARHRDGESLDRLAAAVAELDNSSLACHLIKELAAWKDERVVPALIGFLQNDDLAYQYGDDLGVPALKAQVALREITGHEFPFDVETSRKAWQEGLRIDDRTERAKALAKSAPGGRTPLVATAVGTPTKEMSDALKKRYDKLDEDEFVIAVRVRNLSSLPVTVLEVPSGIAFGWPGGHHGGAGGTDDDDKLEFTTIAPTAETALEVVVTEDFLIAEPATRHLKLSYLANGKRQNVKAWIGSIDVRFGDEWEYKREIKHVEETWPNGNLKAVGTTVNGHKLGEWNYFNEDGDRIRIAYPGTGRGTAICNSEHPENKGAGKRKAK